MLAFARRRGQIQGVRPEHGGRLELKLIAGSESTARYALSIFVPQGEATSEASVDAAGDRLGLADWQGLQPPPWLDALARSLLRVVVRNKLSAGAWPRRISRWRPEPPV